MSKEHTGDLAWIDLSVANAGQVKQFYQEVIGWKVEEVSMGDYNDYSMNSPKTNQAVAGICHAQGVNKDLPPSWLPYFLVEDIDAAVKQVEQLQGELITPIKSMSQDRYAVIKDPSGAVCAIYQKG